LLVVAEPEPLLPLLTAGFVVVTTFGARYWTSVLVPLQNVYPRLVRCEPLVPLVTSSVYTRREARKGRVRTKSPTVSDRPLRVTVPSRYALPLVPVRCFVSETKPRVSPEVNRVNVVTRPALVEVVNDADACVDAVTFAGEEICVTCPSAFLVTCVTQYF
jgi:hypothetical protein